MNSLTKQTQETQMKSVNDQFNEWFDEKYPKGSLGMPPIHESFRAVAYESYLEALSCVGTNFTSKRDEDNKVQFYYE